MTWAVGFWGSAVRWDRAASCFSGPYGPSWKISEKWPKTLPQCNMKCTKNVKMAKNRQKLWKPPVFPYNNFPKKDISLRKCTPKKNFAFGEKSFFSRLRRYTAATPGGGVLYNFWIVGFWDSAIIPGPKCHFSAKKLEKNRPKNGPKVVKNCPKIVEIIRGGPQKIPTNPKNIGKMAKNAPTVQSENAPKK